MRYIQSMKTNSLFLSVLALISVSGCGGGGLTAASETAAGDDENTAKKSLSGASCAYSQMVRNGSSLNLYFVSADSLYKCAEVGSPSNYLWVRFYENDDFWRTAPGSSSFDFKVGQKSCENNIYAPINYSRSEFFHIKNIVLDSQNYLSSFTQVLDQDASSVVTTHYTCAFYAHQ